MTNEEWLKNLTTEELAGKLTGICLEAIMAHGKLNDRRLRDAYWVKWLKAEHE